MPDNEWHLYSAEENEPEQFQMVAYLGTSFRDGKDYYVGKRVDQIIDVPDAQDEGRLIAALPQLMDVCEPNLLQQVLELIRGLPGSHKIAPRLAYKIDRERKAIAKAKGEETHA